MWFNLNCGVSLYGGRVFEKVRMDLPVELKDYIRDIYIFNLKYRVLRNRPYLFREMYHFKCSFSMKSFQHELATALIRRVSRRVRKQIEAKSFYKSLKPRRFFDI